MVEEVKIAYDMEDIERKTDSEKLSLLLRIAFLNHKNLAEHSKVLFGNGTPGICEVVRMQKKGLVWLWSVVIFVSGGLFTAFLGHVMVK